MCDGLINIKKKIKKSVCEENRKEKCERPLMIDSVFHNCPGFEDVEFLSLFQLVFGVFRVSFLISRRAFFLLRYCDFFRIIFLRLSFCETSTSLLWYMSATYLFSL